MTDVIDTPNLDERARDYVRMGDMLEFLAQNWTRRPSLDDLARRMDLSPAHFQRLFTRWAGVSPKAVVRAFSHAEARDLFDQGATVEEVADVLGLSSPSRLYDLFIAHEGVTPGAVRERGSGLQLTIGISPCPFGQAVAVLSPHGLSALGFADMGDEGSVMGDLMARYPAAHWRRDDHAVTTAIDGIFQTASRPTALALYGPPFHLQVWKALLAIPPGATTTYGAIAKALGKPDASRAVGAAVGANPVSWLIPCHRVLASDGRLNGYHWGLNRKAAMLSYERLIGAE